ncbi:hypothetical protein PT974_01618 [Cladobotryum mycophilum]|uniref:C2H2-type domain-containing protein n=1 Tax=Cladobotryum mycophilum TaxID=491253 RepID=A0ABR0T538_9HYPO
MPMDQNHQSQQLQQLAQSQQSQHHHHHHHHRHHQSQSQLSPHQLLQLHQQQQQLDSTPQDVLAEARKNLQVILDSGVSKDLLHQWVDNDLSLQLSFPGQQQQPLAQSLAPAVSPTSSVASTPIQSPLLTHPASHSQTHLQSPSHSQISTLSSPLQQPLPTPAQVALSPVPTITHASPVPSMSGTSTTTTSPTAISSGSTIASSTTEASPATATTPTIVIKSEPSFDDVSGTWATSLPQASTSVTVTSPHDQSFHGAADADSSVFIPPPMPFLNHRPRISVSSTSSGSSGHASLWSVNSAHSSMSWQSTSSSRSMAPLPMPPPMTSTPAAPLMNNPQSAAAANKQNIYWCTSCETSFKRKYDWKRHEDEFHERWRKYPCPEPGCNRSFWGSNSFNQHHKQCHGCKTCPHAEKVVKFLRKRKYWACGFCSALHPARERHVEHVARHFESGLTKSDWMHSRVIYGLLHQPHIHNSWEALVTGKHGELAARRPQFSWHPSKTGRAQGFLEKENMGQLQDLLEFFSGDDGEAQWIVNLAYESADIVFTTPPPVQAQQFAANPMGPPQPFSQQQQQQQQQQDHRMSYSSMPVPSQAQQQGMLASPVSNTPSPFNSSPYRNHIFVPSQGFPSVQQPSPDSATHSPLATTHSPMVPSQAHLEKRELPPIPQQGNSSVMGNGMMDFEYSPAPVIYEDWESLSNATLVDTSQLQHQQPPSNQGSQADWGIPQYFNDPRVTS